MDSGVAVTLGFKCRFKLPSHPFTTLTNDTFLFCCSLLIRLSFDCHSAVSVLAVLNDFWTDLLRGAVEKSSWQCRIRVQRPKMQK